jgi:hypothetical protein
MNIKKRFPRIWNWWPPFLFTGIVIEKFSPDFRYVRVRLKLRFWNANYVGTQYGGSLFSMTDPFYMVMLIENLGKNYSVWDKSALIHYLKPGKTDVSAEFTITQEDISSIIAALNVQDKIEWKRTIDVLDTKSEIIARVEKTISIKKRG